MSDQLNWDEVLGGVEKFESDPDNKKNDDFESLPKGPYQVVVQEANKQVSQKSGNDMIQLRLQVQGGPYANRILFKYLVFVKDKPQSMKITLDQIATLGVTREVIATQRPSIEQIAELLVGRRATAVVDIQANGEYKGRNDVKSIRAPEGEANPVATVTTKASTPGVPNIPTPEAAPAASVPNIPTPDVPVGVGDAADPFEG